MFNERCCTEPSLDELFGDVAVRLLMRRDGVTESDIRRNEGCASSSVAKRGPGAARRRVCSRQFTGIYATSLGLARGPT